MSKLLHKIALVLLLAIIAPLSVVAQNDNVVPLKTSAMNYLFQPPIPWSGGSFTAPVPTPFRRLYIGAGVGVGQVWSYEDGISNSAAAIHSSLFAGYKLAPVHSVELSTTWGAMGVGDYGSIGLSYLFNITSYASRLEYSKRWDLEYVIGAEEQFQSGHNTVVNNGLRVKYNVTPQFGVYAEPKFSVVAHSSHNSPAQVGNFNSAITVGVTFAPYTITDYIKRRREYWSNRNYELQPLFAAKTNLLYDAATVINFEIEVPIGKRYSVVGEWIFPWWCNDDGTRYSKRDRTQLLNGTLEGRYWFGDRSEQQLLCGWFAGAFASYGVYDYERYKKGYQGESVINIGASGGYAHKLNAKGSLRMEYSIGIGYFSSDYSYYEATYGSDNLWHPITLEEGRFKWFGPTRAKVSLVWLITRKRQL